MEQAHVVCEGTGNGRWLLWLTANNDNEATKDGRQAVWVKSVEGPISPVRFRITAQTLVTRELALKKQLVKLKVAPRERVSWVPVKPITLYGVGTPLCSWRKGAKLQAAWCIPRDQIGKGDFPKILGYESHGFVVVFPFRSHAETKLTMWGFLARRATKKTARITRRGAGYEECLSNETNI